jgi:hypothetical protein
MIMITIHHYSQKVIAKVIIIFNRLENLFFFKINRFQIVIINVQSVLKILDKSLYLNWNVDIFFTIIVYNLGFKVQTHAQYVDANSDFTNVLFILWSLVKLFVILSLTVFVMTEENYFKRITFKV